MTTRPMATKLEYDCASLEETTKTLCECGFESQKNQDRGGLAPEQLIEPNPLSISGLRDLSDLGNAERIFDRFGDRLHYSTDEHRWYVWDSTLWNPDSEATLNQWAAETARDIYAEASEARSREEKGRLARHAIKSESDKSIQAMISRLRYVGGIPTREERFDADPWRLNFLNGTVDLSTGELRPHRREDMITKVCPVEFDPGARSDIWDRFLDMATNGDPELRSFLQRAAGYSLCGVYSDEVLFFVYGPAATGKTTFKDALKSVMGSYAVTADISTFMHTKAGSQGPRNDLARLVRSRMVVTDEVEEGSTLAAGLVKLYTGGDTMTARFLYKEHFEFKSRGKLWIVANHPPRVSAEDGAIWRRVLRVPFLNEIPPERQDHDLKRILCDPKISGPAIAAWAVKGCLIWRQNGLFVPESVKRSTDEYRSEMNPVSAFLEDRCTLIPGDSDSQVTSAELWDAYQRWAGEDGIRYPLRRNEFGRHLKLAGLVPGQRPGDRARVWHGVLLNGERRNAREHGEHGVL